MANEPVSNQPTIYQIRVKGHLDPAWMDWFEGLALTVDDSGETLLTGPLADQAALYGLLKKVRDLGLALLAVNCIEPRDSHLSVESEG
jgi:hypothetical protein